LLQERQVPLVISGGARGRMVVTTVDLNDHPDAIDVDEEVTLDRGTVRLPTRSRTDVQDGARGAERLVDQRLDPGVRDPGGGVGSADLVVQGHRRIVRPQATTAATDRRRCLHSSLRLLGCSHGHFGFSPSRARPAGLHSRNVRPRVRPDPS
jgi:hypothetical protein